MTNDTTTLNGALQELGETMASNLQAKGVTASASDGLTTLAGKILTIPAGSCYHIEFSEDSYTAVGGSATLEIYLQENYQPKSGATVTVSGSDSSLYTGITNNEGITTVTVSVSTETTFTATYNNVTDTCTVTVGPSYLFYDGGVTGNVNTDYTKTNSGVQILTNSTGTKVSCTNYADAYYRENALIQGDFRATVTIVDVYKYGGIAFLNTSNSKQWTLEYELDSGANSGLVWNGQTHLNYDTTMGHTIGVQRVGSTITVYFDGVPFSQTFTVGTGDGYLGFKTHSHSSRSITFKDFTITQL